MANLSNINGKFVVEQTTGYVGVGTTDPNYPIEVLNASAEIALNASGGSIYRVQSDSASNFIIRKEGVGDRLVINSAGNATFAGSITGTSANFSGGVNADYFRTLAGNSNYNLFTRDSTGNTIFVQAAQSNASQPIAKFSYGSATVNAGTAVLQVSKDNSHFVNCNVGIGYTSPGSQLSIYKTAFGGDTAGSGGTLDFGVGSTKYWQFRLDSSSSGDLAIDKTYANVWTTPITIQRSSGDVGIGTDNPQNPLHIKKEGYQLKLEDGNTTNTCEILASNNTMGFFSDRANAVASSDMIFSIDNDTKMVIDTDGNVGIGGSPNNFTNQKSLTINGIPGGNSRLDFQINGTNEAEIVANDASLIIAHNDILKFYTAATERMRITSGGNRSGCRRKCF